MMKFGKEEKPEEVVGGCPKVLFTHVHLLSDRRTTGDFSFQCSIWVHVLKYTG